MEMSHRARFGTAAATTVAVFLLYLATLSPSVAMWDAGEYIAAASDMGIPHQPGNPFFLIVAHVAGLLPLSPSYAVRINLLAAVSSAVAAGLWFLCAERLLRALLPAPLHRGAAAVTCAVLGAAAFTVWNQSVVMEKVYPLALVGLALISWLMLVWLDTTPASAARGDRLLVLVAYLTGLTYAVHPAGLLTAPASALAVLRQAPGTIRRWKLIALTAVAFALGTTPFAVLPIRAAHQPYVNESAVSACEDGTIAAGCTFSAETLRRLKATIQREQYGGNAVLERRGPLAAQVGMYWLYFKWQWLRDSAGRMPAAQNLAALVMLVLGLLGLAALRPRAVAGPASGASRDGHLWYFGALTCTFTLLLIYYLNFRYGFSQRPDLGFTVDREPRDRDYFYMWTFSLWGLLAGLGAATLSRRLKPGLAVLALAAVALLPVAGNWRAAERTGQHFTTAWARDMLLSLEPNAILVTNGDNDSFPLWYAQAVEKLRPDVTVALSPYLGMDWYARQLNRRSPLWTLSDEALDSVPSHRIFEQPQRFVHGAIDATIPAGVMTRDQELVLRAIRDSFPSRPVYFSAGQYHAAIGLAPYVKRVGLVSQLMPHALKESPDTMRIGGEWIDVDRTLALWHRYAGAKQVVAEGRWLDNGSAVIPMFYAGVGQQLAGALRAQGREAEALEVLGLVQQVATVLQ